ncbi:MAG: hypothetical protein U9R27_12625 [Campylobacterota bacterium]|nr:hypothetical protein [Campylobacterota bacterium]
MKILFALCLSLVLSQASGVKAEPIKAKQIITVTTKNWSTPSGVLQRYVKKRDQWYRVGKAISVKIGRNGLGWGIGLHKIPKDGNPIKREGDGKAPAGIFWLKQGFGYAPFNISYPYEVYKETDHCVDDVNSKYYNKIVDSTKIRRDYKSFEHMKFPKNFYKYGIVVDHNARAKRGAGSCIFIHIKSIPTAGCTVMSEKQMKEILRWLDYDKNPLLIQAPKGMIGKLLPF